MANAAEYTLVYTDTFTSQDAIYLSGMAPTTFTGNVPFRLVATFDSNHPDFQIPGFNAYKPSGAYLTAMGKTYNILNADVSIFDSSFEPDHHTAVGMIENPPLDEAGFVADFNGASPDFSVNNLMPATFTGYNGTGFQPGAGVPTGCGATGTCTSYFDQPLQLMGDDGKSYLLTMMARDSGAVPAATAEIVASPEPSTVGLLLAAVGIGGLIRRKKSQR